MKTEDLISNSISALFVFFLFNFLMRILLKSVLKTKKGQADGFLFRLKITKPITLSLFGFIALIYIVPILGSILIPNSSDVLKESIREINVQILLLLLSALPAIIYNLLYFKINSSKDTPKS